MAISEQRLSLFALITELEADCRDVINVHVLPDHSLADDIGLEAFENLSRRAKLNSAEGCDETLVINFLDIGDVVKVLLCNRSLLPKTLTKSLNGCIGALERLPAVRNRVMHRRPLQFDDHPTVAEVTRLLLSGPKPLTRRQSHSSRITRPSVSFMQGF